MATNATAAGWTRVTLELNNRLAAIENRLLERGEAFEATHCNAKRALELAKEARAASDLILARLDAINEMLQPSENYTVEATLPMGRAGLWITLVLMVGLITGLAIYLRL